MATKSYVARVCPRCDRTTYFCECALADRMVGRTFVHVSGAVGDDEMTFTDAVGRTVRFFHEQDCCEDVRVEDITGDLGDLVGAPILLAEEVRDGAGDERPQGCASDSCTWTFYKFATVHGAATVRWLGESNGYYSERVDVAEDWKKWGQP